MQLDRFLQSFPAFPGYAVVVGLALALPLSAATIGTSLLDEETDIVNTGGTVISAVHFQNPASGDPDPLVVNGIPHTVGTGSDTNLSINTGFEGDFRNGASGLPTDGSDLVQVLLSGIAGANGINMTIAGLTIGEQYLFQAYWEDDRGITLVLDFEGDTLNNVAAEQLIAGTPGGTLISYQFIATDTEFNALVDRDDALGGDANNWLSGYSLQVVPEPSALLLSAFGAFALLRRRRS